MGLGMYAFARDESIGKEFGFPGKKGDGQLHFWMDHSNLHGWMEDLYRKKGGKGQFNMANVKLTLEDLDDLEAAIIAGELPETQGFFFGRSDDDIDDDMDFIRNARREINDGKSVYYTSWR